MTEIIFKFLLTKKTSRAVKFEYYIIICMKILGLIRLVHISWVFYKILKLSIVELSIERNTKLLVLNLLNKSWVFLQILNLTILKLSIWKILNLSGPGGQVLRLASCMPVSWSSFPTGFHFCEGHNIPFFRFVSFLFYVFFPYIFLVSITPRLSPCHCPFHPRVIALVMALPWPVEFSIFLSAVTSYFF